MVQTWKVIIPTWSIITWISQEQEVGTYYHFAYTLLSYNLLGTYKYTTSIILLNTTWILSKGVKKMYVGMHLLYDLPTK